MSDAVTAYVLKNVVGQFLDAKNEQTWAPALAVVFPTKEAAITRRLGTPQPLEWRIEVAPHI